MSTEDNRPRDGSVGDDGTQESRQLAAMTSSREGSASGDGAMTSSPEGSASGNGARTSSREGFASGDGAMTSSREGSASGDGVMTSSREGCASGDGAMTSLREGSASGDGALTSSREGCASGDGALTSSREGCAEGESGDGGQMGDAAESFHSEHSTADCYPGSEVDGDDAGVCVVRALGRDADGGGERWEADEEALAALLRRHDVARLPAVLVSVAGAYRGGKSFLLDFFLRYLYATESARADGSWLGAAREPLRGFGWRGGCARHTRGLVLWPHPFVVTLPDGEQVVVLLMDTQGSFDEQSSMRDCSLIFALSTLLASVQVYNLSQRIDECDLQHLQVFTEYAAAGGSGGGGGGGGALPALQLLVRDWSAPADFPYGVAGGAAYLQYKLQVRESQPRELRELRSRLAASFERVACCLLPHPGLAAAADPAFCGQLSDMTDNFKASLLEFVPFLLAPERLRVKKVDGRVLRAGDLALHLRAYLDTFRHHVPSPQSIWQAQAAARWLTAAAGARAGLREHAPAAGASARLRAELSAALAAARRAAAEPLADLAAQAHAEDELANLEMELDELVAHYTEVNEAKIAIAVASAREEWERQTGALRAPELCAAARALREAELGARAAAAAHFDRHAHAAQEPERDRLLQDLEARGAVLLLSASAASERNHAAAAASALTALRAGLPAPPPCAHPAALVAAHAAAVARARAVLLGARTLSARDDSDPHLHSLNEEIAVILRKHEAENASATEQALCAARQVYEAAMKLGGRCRHEAELPLQHERAARAAAAALARRRRGAHADDTSDIFGQKLKEWMEKRYVKILHENARNNEAAIAQAHRTFCARMDKLGMLKLSEAELAEAVAGAYQAARATFSSRRLSQYRLGDDDTFYAQLELKISDAVEHYIQKNGNKITRAAFIGSLVGLGLGGVSLALGAAAAAAPGGLLALAAAAFRWLRP